jgi:PAS domain S-box-containing protein
MKTAIDTSHTSFYSISPEGQIAYANEHAAHSLGVLREKLIGSHVGDFDPDFSAEYQASYWKEVKKGGLMRFETHHRRADGTLMPVEVTANYFSFKGEEYSLAFAQDITERKRAEEELALFRHCADRSSDGIFWSNVHGGFDYVNDQACRSLGYTREELLRLKLWDLDDIFPEEQWPTFWKKWQNASEDVIWRTLSFQRRKDGTTFPIEAMAQHIHTSGGRSLLVAYVRDITERKKAEQALRESEERLRQVALVYNIGVFDHDHLTETTYWSPELRECLEVLPTETAGPVTFRRIIHPEDLEVVEAAMQHALDPAGDGRYTMQHRIVSRDGSIKWLDTRSKTFFGGESGARHPTRTVGAVVEITDRMRAQEVLRESVREKETLLREVHHRVKNNLQIISSLLHFQAKKVRDPEDLVVFNEGRNRLRAMILVHERLYKSAGLAQIEFGSYLQALVKDLWHSYAAALGGRIGVHVDADSIKLPIEAALPCGMIVCELLTNSIKYAFPAESSGGIHVALTASGERITLTVSDDGIGLPADFDPAHEKTFGWRLIRSLAAQLGASLTTTQGPGAEVVLQFRSQSPQS